MISKFGKDLKTYRQNKNLYYFNIKKEMLNQNWLIVNIKFIVKKNNR